MRDWTSEENEALATAVGVYEGNVRQLLDNCQELGVQRTPTAILRRLTDKDTRPTYVDPGLRKELVRYDWENFAKVRREQRRTEKQRKRQYAAKQSEHSNGVSHNNSSSKSDPIRYKKNLAQLKVARRLRWERYYEQQAAPIKGSLTDRLRELKKNKSHDNHTHVTAQNVQDFKLEQKLKWIVQGEELGSLTAEKAYSMIKETVSGL